MKTLASRGRQHGVALLVLVMIIALSVAFIVVTAMNKSGPDLALERDRITQAALDRAKQALLAYAVADAESSMALLTHNPNRGVPGYLPCPDQGTTEGVQFANCGTRSVSTIGRLPWKTLELEPLRDGDGECLWYAVSGTYKNWVNGVDTGTANMMNWDTPGLFDVFAADGTTLLAGDVVAVILAPGEIFTQNPVQNRSNSGNTPRCGGNYNAAAYLETAGVINNSAVSAGAGAITQFIAGRASNTFNDRLVYITRGELWAAIKKRPDFQQKLRTLTQKVAECVAKYGTRNDSGTDDKRLPWATDLTAPNSNYDVDALYDDVSPKRSGRIPYLVETSKADTNNNLSGAPYYLFALASYCRTSGTFDDHDINWYSNWKDHLFYALAKNSGPTGGGGSGGDEEEGVTTPSCSGGTNGIPTTGNKACLQVTGGGNTRYAAIVIFAGERLPGLIPPQVRDTPAQRANIVNYLEDANASNHPNNDGNGVYKSGPPSAGFNDLLYCVNQNLTVNLCP